MEVHFRRLTPPEHQAATARLLFTLADFLTGRLNFTVTLSNPGLWRGLIASGTASPELSGVLNRLRTAHASQRPSSSTNLAQMTPQSSSLSNSSLTPPVPNSSVTEDQHQNRLPPATPWPNSFEPAE